MTTNRPRVTATRTASATIAATGIPEASAGCQKSAPVSAARWSRALIGTRQSNTFVRLSSSLTCGGTVFSDIQWMRWSCHSKRPVRLTVCHCGAAFGSALAGTGVPP